MLRFDFITIPEKVSANTMVRLYVYNTISRIGFCLICYYICVFDSMFVFIQA